LTQDISATMRDRGLVCINLTRIHAFDWCQIIDLDLPQTA